MHRNLGRLVGELSNVESVGSKNGKSAEGWSLKKEKKKEKKKNYILSEYLLFIQIDFLLMLT